MSQKHSSRSSAPYLDLNKITSKKNTTASKNDLKVTHKGGSTTMLKKPSTRANLGTKTQFDMSAKENIAPSLPDHLSERGREYELQRRQERHNREQRALKLAAAKAAKKSQKADTTTQVTNITKATNVSNSRPNTIAEDTDETEEDAMDIVASQKHHGKNNRVITDEEEDKDSSEDKNEEDTDEEGQAGDDEDEDIRGRVREFPEAFVPSTWREAPVKTHKVKSTLNLTSPIQPSTPSLHRDPRHTVSSPTGPDHHPVNALKRKVNQVNSSATESLDIDVNGPPAGSDDDEEESNNVASPPRKRRVRDFNGTERYVIKLAQEEFQVRVCTQYAFPEDMDDKVMEWVAECWENACDRQECSLELSRIQEKLIRKRTSTIRGRVKDKAVARVPSLYGFRDTTDDADIEYNKQLAVKLLKDLSFIYLDADKARGMYEHPILQAVINAQFFANRLKSTGVEYSASFNPMPDETIALVFTAVQFVITRWAKEGMASSTGLFTEEEWHPVYKTHLEGLKKWTEYSDHTARAVARLKQKLFNFGSKIAGVKRTADPGEAFSDEMLARAAAALDDD